jgi:ATP-dependent DNA ligase
MALGTGRLMRDCPFTWLDGERSVEGERALLPAGLPTCVNRDMSVPMTFVVFDVLQRDGADLTRQPYLERRQDLEGLSLDGPAWTT